MSKNQPIDKLLAGVMLATGLAVAIQMTPAQAQSGLFDSEAEEVRGAYLGYYARSADPTGLVYWTSRLIAEGGNLDALIAAFANSPEAQELYGDKSDSEIIDMLYQALFGREPDDAGKAFYLQGLASGAMTPESIALDILFGAQGEDVAVLENKLEVSEYFTDQVTQTGATFNADSAWDNIDILDGVTGAEDTVAAGKEASDVFMIAWGDQEATFKRVATFPVYLNLADDEDMDSETASEIVYSAHGGNTLVYTDSPMERIGFVDITEPSNPQPAGFFALGGEPTSVAVKGDYALVGVNTSESFVAPSGYLSVVDISDITNPRELVQIDLGGQPDSVAVSPDGMYAAIAIENERDEDACAAGDGTLIDAAFGDEDACDAAGGIFGGLPQLPAGFLSIVELSGDPTGWTAQAVDLTGLADVAPIDPEPEYVDINGRYHAAVTLQENNHLVVVDLATGAIESHFPLGAVSLTNIDALENDLIDLLYDLDDLAREPDAVTWVFDDLLATANEGDWLGGSRGWTTFNPGGLVILDAGESFEYDAVMAGHYPEFRAENKGAEPEGVESARFGSETYLFVGSERGNFVEVFSASADTAMPVQVLATGIGPEGLLAIPHRGLFVVAAEEDDADEGFRSTISIYQLAAQAAEYPQIKSSGDLPIGWGALSGLAGDREDPTRLYTVHDSFYDQSRIYLVDLSQSPADIHEEIVLMQGGATVDYDLEGIAQRADGSFWVVSEGNADTRPNLLVEVAADGTVVQEIGLPPAVVANARSNGFEGVAVIGSGEAEEVFVAVQREWEDDPAGYVKIGRYLPATDAWDFYYYPLDEAPEGAWVGLSELTALDDAGTFAVVERDNQQGPSAQVKRVYQVSLDATVDEGLAYPVFQKTLLRDLLPDLAARNGWIPDKVEGLALSADGQIYVVTDNDGVDDALGETYFLRLGPASEAFATE